MILAEGDYVIVHCRFSNIRLPMNWIAAGVVRSKDGILVHHWDVIRDSGRGYRATVQERKPGDAIARIVSTIPMGRMGDPDESAKAASVLASIDSS